MSKRISWLLAILLCLSVLASPGAWAESDRETSSYEGYIVKLKDPDNPPVFALSSESGLSAVWEEAGLYSCEYPGTVLDLMELGLLEYMEPNYTVRLLDSPNDPYYSKQSYIPVIRGEAIWDSGIDVSRVRVGVIDSGVYTAHEDLADANIAAGYNLYDDNKAMRDSTGHGTFVCGVLAAVRNNAIGVAGLVDGIEIIPFKCFGAREETSINYIVTAIYKAVDEYGCDVLNLSLGLTQSVKSLLEAINYAASRDVLVVAAVGNFGTSELYYPAAYGNVVGVSSVDKDNKVSGFSQKNQSVFVAAPGENLFGLGHGSTDAYVEGSGTSFSTPQVSALAAVAKAYDGEMSVSQFKALLAMSATDLGDPGYDFYYGHGLINAEKFIELLKADSYSELPPELTQLGRLVYSETAVAEAAAFDLSPWFTDPGGASLNYFVHADTAFGDIEISGQELIYTPAAKDAGKTIRIIVGANNGSVPSLDYAVLTVAVGASDAPGLSSGYLDTAGHWADRYIAAIADRGLWSGVGEGLFAPDAYMNRAMFVTVLGRCQGESLPETSFAFTDIPADSWFEAYVGWGAHSGVVTGFEDGTFRPLTQVSREQMAVFMYRFAKTFGHSDGAYDTSVLYGFEDLSAISPWAFEAVCWAVQNGLISGRTQIGIDPLGYATRGEVSAIMARFLSTF